MVSVLDLASLRSLRAAALTCCVLAGAVACTSSEGGGSSGTPSAAGPAVPSSSAPSAGPSAAATGAPFDGACRTASAIRTARVDARTLAGGQLFRVQGQESFSGGQLQSADFDVAVGDKRTRVVVADQTLYAKGPAVGSTGKYVVVGGQSSDQSVRAFEFELGLTLEYARPQLFCDIRTAATSVRSLGARSVHGIRTQGYAFASVSAKLPATSVLRAEQSQNGVTSAPTTMDVDSRGRPVRITQDYPIADSKLSSSAVLYDLDKAVDINAPDPDEISG